jgi:predicted nucleic acid-binding protein
VIVLDANLLLYAYDSGSQLHAKARAWVEQTFSDGTPVGLPWQTVTAFLRIVTNPRLSGKRFTPEETVQIVDPATGILETVPTVSGSAFTDNTAWRESCS